MSLVRLGRIPRLRSCARFDREREAIRNIIQRCQADLLLELLRRVRLPVSRCRGRSISKGSWSDIVILVIDMECCMRPKSFYMAVV